MRYNPFEERMMRKEYKLPPFSRAIAKKEAEDHLNRFEEPALNLLELLSQQIEARVFDSILSDDSSSRIHSLVLGQAIQDLYGDDKRLQIVFVQGGSLLFRNDPLDRTFSKETVMRNPLLRKRLGTPSLVEEPPVDPDEPELHPGYRYQQTTTHADEVRAYLERMRPRLGTASLIVTEEVHSTGTVNTLAGMLERMGVYAEAATFGTSWDEDVWVDEFHGENPCWTSDGFRLFIGCVGRTGPTAPDGSLGIYDRWRSGFGHPVRQEGRTISGEIIPEIRYRMNATREAARELGHRLADEYRRWHR